MERKSPTDALGWEWNALRRGSERSGVKRARLQALSRYERDLLRRRSNHAAEKPGRIVPWRDLNAMRRDTSPFPRSPVPPPFRTPFSNRKNVRRLFAEEERPCSAGPRQALPAGYGA